MRNRHFAEYRASDYRTARSMKELYGYEPPLYVMEKDSELDVVVGVAVVGLLFIAAALFVWVI